MLELTTHKVLVGISGDEDAGAALEYAAEEARRRGCGVHLVSIVHPVATSSEAASFNILEGLLHGAVGRLLGEHQGPCETLGHRRLGFALAERDTDALGRHAGRLLGLPDGS